MDDTTKERVIWLNIYPDNEVRVYLSHDSALLARHFRVKGKDVIASCVRVAYWAADYPNEVAGR